MVQQAVAAALGSVDPDQAVPGPCLPLMAQQAMAAALGSVDPGQAVPGPCLHLAVPQAVPEEAVPLQAVPAAVSLQQAVSAALELDPTDPSRQTRRERTKAGLEAAVQRTKMAAEKRLMVMRLMTIMQHECELRAQTDSSTETR